uniref:Plant-inducible protein n=1 Tax=Kwoniella dejecticola CBS 10117 TaxID=1296121 RepID=A0A1A6AAZ4_9TREE|nr:uncharacterized protein I303_03266 [Kwoniella dejecticola CBS 10117]OBR87241.1 hypothetical protein I303_03266 [Kwoniella dejecticola CBS 10117]
MSSQLTLTTEKAEQLIRVLTDGLVNIKDEEGKFLLHLPNGFAVNTKTWDGWEWTHGVAHTFLTHVSAEPAKYSVKTVLDWFEYQYKATDGKGCPKNINTMAPFYSLICLMQDGKTNDPRWSAWVDEWAEWIMTDLPRTEERGFQHMNYRSVHYNNLWDDTLMMTVIPLAKIGVVLDRPQYIKESIYQFLLHIRYLMDPVTGLWYHGWCFTPDGKPTQFSKNPNVASYGHHFSAALWARGNSWITLAIPMLLEILQDKLEKDDPVRLTLISVLKRQIDALIPLQDPQMGLWRTLLVDKETYVETSASAGFAAGIYMSLRLGLISGDQYRLTADRALQGVVEQIDDSGEVGNVSYGTGVGLDLQFYKDIPITPMPYGQALAMAALVEWERLTTQ